MKIEKVILTKVIFRKFKSDGEIIALFPDIAGSHLYSHHCQSYVHMGQHGSADVAIVDFTSLATEEEYKELKAELETHYGYNLQVAKKFTQKNLENRKNQIMR